MLPGAAVQPSFCGFFTLEQDATASQDSLATRQALLDSIDVIHEPLDYEFVANATVKRRTLASGLVDRTFLETAGGATFYRGPTIAPVEFTEAEPDYLEHPESAFAYYRERGVERLSAEYKYMGSRAHLIAFRNRAAAAAFGWSADRGLLTVLSRSGRQFFGGKTIAQPTEWEAHFARRLEAMDADWAVLDAEILPWTLKAPHLVAREFRTPGECALAARTYHYGGESAEAERARDFLETLSHYDTEAAPLQLRLFDVLAMPGWRSAEEPCEERYAAIDMLCAGGAAHGILPVEHFDVDLGVADSTERCVQRWLAYCAGGGEGIVLKVAPRLKQLRDGALVLPMVKVRGRDYLRLIYGMDYLTPECFALLRRRRVAAKRLLALKEWELANRLLEACIAGETAPRDRYLAAFCGLDSGTHVDATL